jgi:hypothetical protein
VTLVSNGGACGSDSNEHEHERKDDEGREAQDGGSPFGGAGSPRDRKRAATCRWVLIASTLRHAPCIAQTGQVAPHKRTKTCGYENVGPSDRL